MTAMNNDYRERLAAEAGRIRESGDLGRSEPLIRLFDFLLERSLAGRVPKEIEIAQEVFGKTTDFDVMQDASVRVYIHRLRRKLGDHYTRHPGNLDRLSIPLGEYRLVLAFPADEAEPAGPQDIAGPGSTRRIGRLWPIVLAFALLNVLAWVYFIGRPPAEAGALMSNLWKPIVETRRPTLVALGDYYIFGDAPDGLTVTRLVRDFAINSQEQLDAYLLLNPDKFGRYVDVNLHYLPVSVGPALRSLLPIVNAAAKPSGLRPQIGNMSDMALDISKNVNIVYVGFLSGLGQLQGPLFRASGFKIGANYDELVDKASGRRFKSDWGIVADGKMPQRDYGYIASLPGPSGNRILIIAGTRDPAVAQMAEVAADPRQLAAIDAKAGGNAFEALFEVRTLGNLNLGSSLVLARNIHADKVWQPE
jgi:hypothetical protein